MANTKLILGIVAGASIGAIAAILFSPAKGSDTRQRLAILLPIGQHQLKIA